MVLLKSLSAIHLIMAHGVYCTYTHRCLLARKPLSNCSHKLFRFSLDSYSTTTETEGKIYTHRIITIL